MFKNEIKKKSNNKLAISSKFNSLRVAYGHSKDSESLKERCKYYKFY